MKNQTLEVMRYLQLAYGVMQNGHVSRLYDGYMANNFRLFDTVLEETGKSFIVDSSKNYLKAVGLYRTIDQVVPASVLFHTPVRVAA